MLLPSGSVVCDAGDKLVGRCGAHQSKAAAPLAPEVGWQHLSVNHYVAASVAACQAKARRTHFHGSGRNATQCLRNGLYHRMVIDPVLAAHANATRARQEELFPTKRGA